MWSEEILKNRYIIVVDDDRDILETLEDLFYMCMVDKVLNFETAEKLLEENTYDAAIFDIVGVDGHALLDIAISKNIPAIMLTAHALDPENMTKSLKGGAYAYLPKDKMSDVSRYVTEAICAHFYQSDTVSDWYRGLSPFFDKKFGIKWREKDRAFWRNFEKMIPPENFQRALMKGGKVKP